MSSVPILRRRIWLAAAALVVTAVAVPTVAAKLIAGLANLPSTHQGQAGPNPMKRALITKAYLAPASKFTAEK